MALLCRRRASCAQGAKEREPRYTLSTACAHGDTPHMDDCTLECLCIIRCSLCHEAAHANNNTNCPQGKPLSQHQSQGSGVASQPSLRVNTVNHKVQETEHRSGAHMRKLRALPASTKPCSKMHAHTHTPTRVRTLPPHEPHPTRTHSPHTPLPRVHSVFFQHGPPPAHCWQQAAAAPLRAAGQSTLQGCAKPARVCPLTQGRTKECAGCAAHP